MSPRQKKVQTPQPIVVDPADVWTTLPTDGVYAAYWLQTAADKVGTAVLISLVGKGPSPLAATRDLIAHTQQRLAKPVSMILSGEP